MNKQLEKGVLVIAPYGTRRWRFLTMLYRSIVRGEAFRISQLGMDHVFYAMTPRPVRRLLRGAHGIGRLQLLQLRMQSLLRKRTNSDIENEDVLLRQLDALITEGKLWEASAQLKLFLKVSPFCVAAYRQLAWLQTAMGDYSASLRTLLTAQAVSPATRDLLIQLAALHQSTGAFWEAERILKQILSKWPDDSEAMSLLADLAMMHARYDRARELYRSVLKHDPENRAAQYVLDHCRNSKPVLKLSVIILVWNELDHTKRCLTSLKGAYPNMEVIVVDNGSDSQVQAYLQSQSSWIRIVRNDTNEGFVKASNQGARLATGDALLFLNNDTIVNPSALESLAHTMERDSSIGAVGAKLLYPSGLLQEAGGVVFADGSAWNYGKGKDPKEPEYNYVRDTAYCSAACLLVRAEAFRSVEGFDERYSPAYFEDTDLAFSLREKGYRVLYQPESTIEHVEGATAGTDTASGLKRFQSINQAKFREKWSGALAKQPAFAEQNVRIASRQGARHRILMVDHFLPAFDRYSGEHRSFQILRMLKEEGHDITYLARHGECQDRYKHALQQLGVEVFATDRDRMLSWDHPISAARIDFEEFVSKRQFHLAIIARYQIAQVYMPVLRRYAPQLPILVDSIDVHFLRERRKAELYGNNEIRKTAETVRYTEMSVYSQSQGVIVVTEQDKQALLQEGLQRPVFVLPNIHPVIPNPQDFAARKDLVFVGNFLHPPNSDAAMFLCGRIFPIIQQELPQVKLYIAGANSFQIAPKLRQDGVIVTGYVPSLEPYLQGCRVSVAPLRYGAGMKGKIGEAMSAGLPVVTTTTGAEGMKAQTGTHLLVEDDPRRFADAVVRLYQDETLWSSVSHAGRKLIADLYTPEKLKPVLQDIILQSAGHP